MVIALSPKLLARVNRMMKIRSLGRQRGIVTELLEIVKEKRDCECATGQQICLIARMSYNVPVREMRFPLTFRQDYQRSI
ncbi:MAG: hypothetical protein WCF84_09650 [Anaerolineae bacterium]